MKITLVNKPARANTGLLSLRGWGHSSPESSRSSRSPPRFWPGRGCVICFGYSFRAIDEITCRFAWEWIENSQACWLGVSNFWCHLLRIHLLTVSCSLVAKFQPNLPSSSKLADSTNSLVQMTAPWLSCSAQDQVRPDLSSTLVSTAEVFTTPHFSCSHALLVCMYHST